MAREQSDEPSGIAFRDDAGQSNDIETWHGIEISTNRLWEV
jgi:hypothetical protein